MDETFECPLICKGISSTECYDIQMVKDGLIKAHVLDFELDAVKAETLCPKCTFNQLQQK